MPRSSKFSTPPIRRGNKWIPGPRLFQPIPLEMRRDYNHALRMTKGWRRNTPSRMSNNRLDSPTLQPNGPSAEHLIVNLGKETLEYIQKFKETKRSAIQVSNTRRALPTDVQESIRRHQMLQDAVVRFGYSQGDKVQVWVNRETGQWESVGKIGEKRWESADEPPSADPKIVTIRFEHPPCRPEHGRIEHERSTVETRESEDREFFWMDRGDRTWDRLP